MWITVMLSIAVFAVAFIFLAIGVLFGKAPIKGSCGGLDSTGDGCDVCGRGAGEPCKQEENAESARRLLTRFLPFGSGER